MFLKDSTRTYSTVWPWQQWNYEIIQYSRLSISTNLLLLFLHFFPFVPTTCNNECSVSTSKTSKEAGWRSFQNYKWHKYMFIHHKQVSTLGVSLYNTMILQYYYNIYYSSSNFLALSFRSCFHGVMVLFKAWFWCSFVHGRMVSFVLRSM